MKVRKRELVMNSGRDCYTFEMRVVGSSIDDCYIKVIREFSTLGLFRGVTCRGYHDMDFHGYAEYDTLEEFEEGIPYLTDGYGWESASFCVTIDGENVSCSLKPGELGVCMDIVGMKGSAVDRARDRMIDFAEENGWIWGPRPVFDD